MVRHYRRVEKKIFGLILIGGACYLIIGAANEEKEEKEKEMRDQWLAENKVGRKTRPDGVKQ